MKGDGNIDIKKIWEKLIYLCERVFPTTRVRTGGDGIMKGRV